MTHSSGREVNNDFTTNVQLTRERELAAMIQTREETIKSLQKQLEEAENKLKIAQDALVLAKRTKSISYIDINLLPSEYYGETIKDKIKKCKLDTSKGLPIFYIR